MIPLTAASLILLLTALCIWRHVSHRSTNVPVVPGLPLFGNLIALGRGGVAFISQCRDKFGDVFCLRLLTQRMVFVFDPELITFFLRAPETSVSFKPAVEQFTDRVYGIPSAEFFPVHEQLLATLRDLLSPDKLEVMAQQLLQYAEEHLQDWRQQGRVELWSAVQSLVFRSAGRVLFGEAFFNRHGLQEVQEAFLTFEGYFEVAASPLPHLLLPKFCSARARLLSMFSASLSAGDFADTVVGRLLQGCGMPARYWPNLLLAILWASQANSMPALFWCIAMLMSPEQQAARKQIMQELHEAVQQQQQLEQQQQTKISAGTVVDSSSCSNHLPRQEAVDSVTTAAMTAVAMDRRSYAARCVAEAIRLRAHSIAVRFVSAKALTLTVKGRAKGHRNGQSADDAQRTIQIRQGTMLAICPFISHHDERLYPEDPWRFDPNRREVQGLAPGTVSPGIAGLGFGGGFWRCPGRFFAEMELVLLVLMVLQRLQLTPEDLSSHHKSRGHEQHNRTAGCNKVVNSILAGGGKAVSRLLPSFLVSWGYDLAIYGAGLFEGSRLQAGTWFGSAGQWQSLPPPDLLRLVGFKVPQGTWWVRVQ